jgi:hypothetical protein
MTPKKITAMVWEAARPFPDFPPGELTGDALAFCARLIDLAAADEHARISAMIVDRQSKDRPPNEILAAIRSRSAP